MAPPPKAPKSDITMKVYDITRDLRRHIDAADRKGKDVGMIEYNEAIAKARELVTYLANRLEEKMALSGGGNRIHNTNGDER